MSLESNVALQIVRLMCTLCPPRSLLCTTDSVVHLVASLSAPYRISGEAVKLGDERPRPEGQPNIAKKEDKFRVRCELPNSN